MFRSIKTDLRFVDETLHDCTYIDPPPLSLTPNAPVS